MVAQTITTEQNYDGPTHLGLVDGDQIAVDGGVLTINSDSRWGQQAAVMGSLTISAINGGTVLIDGRATWQIEFTGGTGTIPMLGDLGTNGVTGSTSGATGELLGVYAQGGKAPASGAMPTSGYIKLRAKTGNFQNGETITLFNGAQVTVNSATGGRRSWIHVVGRELTTITVPRLGLFKTTGDWFHLGVTNGLNDQVFEFPVEEQCPALQIETAPGSGVYEWWLCAGSKWGNVPALVATDLRGKYFGTDNTGKIILANTLVGDACGHRPVAGCRVRIPNIILSNAVHGVYDVNTRAANVTNRYDFTTTGGGYLEIENTIGHWFFSFSGNYYHLFRNNASSSTLSVSNTAAWSEISDFAFGFTDAQAHTPLSISNCFSGFGMKNVRLARYSAGNGSNVASIVDCSDVVIENLQVETFGATAAVVRSDTRSRNLTLLRCINVSVKNLKSIGSQCLINASIGVKVDGFYFADIHNGLTTTSQGIVMFTIEGNSNQIEIVGVSAFEGLIGLHPYNNMFTVNNASNVTIRNIGTPDALYRTGTGTAVPVMSGLIGSTVSKNINLVRCYLERVRSTLVTAPNTVQGVVVENVWSEGTTDHVRAVDTQSRGTVMDLGTTVQNTVYGSHWRDGFISSTTGAIQLLMNEPISSTAAQCWVSAGSPVFSATGLLVFRALGDQVTWECPWNILGHTAISNIDFFGTNANNTNLLFEYQTSDGESWSAWKRESDLASETIDPTSGFYIRIRITRISETLQPSLSFFRINTTTTADARKMQYPDGSVLVLGPASTDRINLRRLSDNALLASREGAGYIKFTSQPGQRAYLTRRNASGVEIMRTQTAPFELNAGDAPSQAMYAGDQIQLANASDLPGAVRSALLNDLAPVKLIPALL